MEIEDVNNGELAVLIPCKYPSLDPIARPDTPILATWDLPHSSNAFSSSSMNILQPPRRSEFFLSSLFLPTSLMPP